MSGARPAKAMVLAAGLGKRMRPITETLPKPLIEIGGKTLLDRALDSLADADVGTAVVNVHYLPDQIVSHVSRRENPKVVISDESAKLLDSAGGVVKALPSLGAAPFFILNADTFWIDRSTPALASLALAWSAADMDILLMLADPASATGHTGTTDFLIGDDNRLARARGDPEGLIYAGAAIVNPAVFAGARARPHSLNLYFDRAIAAGRLFGCRLDGHWITVGTPAAIPLAEKAIERASAPTR